MKIVAGILGVLVVMVLIAVAWLFKQPQFGGKIEGARLERITKSPEFTGERFENHPPQSRNNEWLKTVSFYLKGQVREPQFEVPVVRISPAELDRLPANGLTAIWLGHASVLVEIGGVRIVTDPVLSELVSPVTFGPKRLHAAPIAMNDLRHVEVVLISHDHYDHLDMTTIQALAANGSAFFVPLGIGAHLERWGVKPEKIHEMDWWESLKVKDVEIHCTPARHYSGRKKMDNSTLWSSWLVKNNTHSFYFSGDSGYSSHFAEIKKRLGPVNLTLMKVGAYGDPESWIDIHMNPESAIQAHLDLGAQILLPIHWATFNLAYHAWDEPIERTLVAARGKPLTVITPKAGERFEFGHPFQSTAWYKK